MADITSQCQVIDMQIDGRIIQLCPRCLKDVPIGQEVNHGEGKCKGARK